MIWQFFSLTIFMLCESFFQYKSYIFAVSIMGVTGFDSRQSLIVSTSSIVWWLVNINTQLSNGNNSYALAA